MSKRLIILRSSEVRCVNRKKDPYIIISYITNLYNNLASYKITHSDSPKKIIAKGERYTSRSRCRLSPGVAYLPLYRLYNPSCTVIRFRVCQKQARFDKLKLQQD